MSTRRFIRVRTIADLEAVRAGGLPSAAFTNPLVSSPQSSTVASSHRTDARPTPRRLIPTPLGLTTRFSL